MKPPKTNEAIMFNTQDCKPDMAIPDFCLLVNYNGDIIPVYVNSTSSPTIFTGGVCDWDFVHKYHRYFGMTDLQAKEAEAAGVEF